MPKAAQLVWFDPQAATKPVVPAAPLLQLGHLSRGRVPHGSDTRGESSVPFDMGRSFCPRRLGGEGTQPCVVLRSAGYLGSHAKSLAPICGCAWPSDCSYSLAGSSPVL